MNYTALLNSATMGNPSRLRPLIFWTIVEYFFRGAPYGILLMIVWELFKPLQYPGTKLNIWHIVLAWISLLISLVILYIVNRKSYYAAYKDSYKICADGRINIAEHLRKLSMGFFNTRDPGDIAAYLVTDYANIENLISHILPQLFGALVMPLVLLVSLAFFSWKLAIAAALVIPLAWPAAWISTKIIDYTGRKHQKTQRESVSRMIEYIHGIRLIKAFNLSGTKFERLEKAFRRLKSESIRLEGSADPTMLLASFVLNSGFTLIMLLGFTFLISGEIPLPVYIMFLILGTRIYEPLFHALMFIGELNYMKLGIERIENLRKALPLPEGDENEKINHFNIEFKDVLFSYNNKQILNNLNITIPEHSLIALVGPSGSGKTTVIRLIARFWDTDKGEILIGGKNIKAYNTDQLLSKISMVFQDVYLFNDTIYNNIKIGKDSATYEEIIAATRAARCHEFIEELPQKYNTIVGEGGNSLSGGEKQRISIARAILKNAPVILLDEATASLDPENEIHIQQAINDLVKNKTVIVIAHKLETITHADKIIVMDNGRVIEEGVHSTLLTRNGLYKNLWDEQQRVKGWKF